MYTLVSLVSVGIGVTVAPASVENYQLPGIVIRKCPEIGEESEIAIAILKENNNPAARAFVELALRNSTVRKEKLKK
jgi:DNA-binding transcriptional LysR family regulator